ncbi:methionine adenosyltransferase [Candidatus Darwinibacter acetoxidans]|nr:methionine adenosyltransferase [Bacillota bacterium]
MTARRYMFTSESVTEGHPDKVCDQLSDAVLDSILSLDPQARVACEAAISTGLVLIFGEISTQCYVDIPNIVREVIRDIGYDRAKYGFDADTCAVLTSIEEQSPDIAIGVNQALEKRQGTADQFSEVGAGDQGMMFGYATDETPSLMPMPIDLAHKLAKRLAEVRKAGIVPYLRPDGKTQISIIYDEEHRPIAVDNVVVSAQHHPDVDQHTISQDLYKHVIEAVIPPELWTKDTKVFINPTGRFVVGGPKGDSGLTGRKIIVDTYGGCARHGGGAFSGKDPTKVDRSASYAARYVAKNIVAAGLAKRVEVQVAYAIGVANPVSLFVDTFGTGVIPDAEIERAIRENFDLRPAAIIRDLDLRRPIYRQVAAYGHFGRLDLDLPWERVDKAAALKR